MKKKIYISFLTLVFFLSTTSLPLSVHQCRMMKDMPSDKCGMCNTAEETNDLKIKNEKSSCCSTKLVDTTVKDNFLSNKTHVNDFQSLKLYSDFILADGLFNSSYKLSFIDKDTSPPPLKTNDLYLVNSILLI